jgi:hypothetical protein
METQPPRKPYPSDVTDEEWAFVASYLTLMRPDAPQRVHDPRDVYNALRWIVRAGAPWRYLRRPPSRPGNGYGFYDGKGDCQNFSPFSSDGNVSPWNSDEVSSWRTSYGC